MKSNIRRFLSAIAITFLGMSVLSTMSYATVGDQDRDGQCTIATLQGSYGYFLSGSLIGLGPVAAVGIMTLDGTGNLTARDTVSNSGVIGHRTGSGTYIMNSNCTGSVNLDGDFLGFSADFTVIPEGHGTGFTFIVTSSGTNQSGEAKKVARPRTFGDPGCTQADLQGTYRVLGEGTTPPGLVTAVGYRILDGQGNLTWAEDTRSVAGVISHRIGRTATYTVDSSCALNEVFADGLTFDGVIVAGGREAFFVRTNPGTVITALYKKSGEGDNKDWPL